MVGSVGLLVDGLSVDIRDVVLTTISRKRNQITIIANNNCAEKPIANIIIRQPLPTTAITTKTPNDSTINSIPSIYQCDKEKWLQQYLDH